MSGETLALLGVCAFLLALFAYMGYLLYPGAKSKELRRNLNEINPSCHHH